MNAFKHDGLFSLLCCLDEDPGGWCACRQIESHTTTDRACSKQVGGLHGGWLVDRFVDWPVDSLDGRLIVGKQTVGWLAGWLVG